jgi:hypothetical protein
MVGRLLCTYLHPPSGADEICEESWQQSLLFVMEVMVQYFVSDTHKVITTLLCVMLVLVLLKVTQFLHSNCYCGVSSAMTDIKETASTW